MFDEAANHLETKWTPLTPEQKTVWQATIALGRGQYEEVLRLAESVDLEAAQMEVPLAITYAKQGAHDKALALAQQAVKRNLSGAERAMGHIYAEIYDYEQALIWYERAAWRLEAKSIRDVGKTLMAMGDYHEACVVFDAAIRRSAFVHVKDLQQLAECLRKTGKDKVAEEVERLAQEQESRMQDG